MKYLFVKSVCTRRKRLVKRDLIIEDNINFPFKISHFTMTKVTKWRT